MAQAKLSLSWDAHQKNICSGLSSLQQRGEFVDMTLAADGHLVKVHQMVLALVSPYIKDLISSAPCPHPVIFLNNVSYTTLCEILEYIYTGEVLVPKESLGDLIAAGKALHIKGLKDMYKQDPPDARMTRETEKSNQSFLIDTLKEKKKSTNEEPVLPMCKIFVDDPNKDANVTMDEMDSSTDNYDIIQDEAPKNNDKSKSGSSQNVQFSVTPQGGLQAIYNRYMYNLRYIKKNRSRLWRCVNYSSARCPAKLVTNAKNTVAKRPCANGMVERMHRQLKASLMCHSSTWTKALPLVLLGMRTALKEDIKAYSAELVYGETLRLPGEFITPPDVPRNPNVVADFVTQLRSHLEALRPVPASHHSRPSTFIFKDLPTASHVWLRDDTAKRSLQPPYSGPYPIISRRDKTLTINYKGNATTVSIDRVKPAHLESSTIAPPISQTGASDDQSLEILNPHPCPTNTPPTSIASTSIANRPVVTRCSRRVHFKRGEFFCVGE